MKERKFTTPVSMECTEEQYERDLKQPLKELGYEYDGCSILTNLTPYLCTNWGGNCSLGAAVKNHSILSSNHVIPSYNPKLFLALAAMTEGEDWIVGEWLIYNDIHQVDRLFEVKYIDKGNDYTEGRASNNCASYWEATKEELINHFSDEDIPKYIRCETNQKESYFKKGIIYKVIDSRNHSSVEVETNMKIDAFDAGDSLYVTLRNSSYYSIANKEEYEKQTLKKEMKNESRFPFELDLEGARKIIDVSCSDWRSKLRKKWSLLLDKPTILISESFHTTMRNACDDKQHKVLDEVFGKDEESVEDKMHEFFKGNGCLNRTTVSTDGVNYEYYLNTRDLKQLLETFNIEFKK